MEDQCISVMLIDSDNSDFEFENEDSSSDEEDDEMLILAYLNAPVKDKRKIPRITNYIDGTISKYTAHEFKISFQMPKKQLLIALWMMANTRLLQVKLYLFQSVCEKFDVGLATALRSVRRVSHALHSLAPQFIRWPRGEHAREVAREFERHSAFPGVVGAIDGTHIKINAPNKGCTILYQPQRNPLNPSASKDRSLEAVCTHDMLFTSVFAGYAGSVHDARVFRLHIIGDAAYGVHQHIMVPFKKQWDICHRDKTISIFRAFGLWKTRWRSILDCLPMVTVKKIPEYLLALAVLHNICILQRDLITIEEESLRVGQRGRLVVNGREEGMRKRQILCNNLVLRTV
ncbi:hypothetical protein ABMA28_017322 [Loxostege sticticalis]|uniref:DDE Tnp4 domain-containing protein n=1 Tax=Loxostege sticticalis TaxID=481309 RepID=A0ABD0S5N5_LOXSC